MSLLKEFAKGDLQQSLKNSDGSDAGRTDTASPTDVRFSLMRNMINHGNVTGSSVSNYLERAHELNDEVDSVGFAIETDNGDLIKVYVNAQHASEFETECASLLGVDDDVEVAINQLAQKYDIVDVVWPQDPAEGDGEISVASGDDVSIDDDLSSFIDDDMPQDDDTPSDDEATPQDDDTPSDDDTTSDDEATPQDDDTPSDDEATAGKDAKPKKSSLMKDIANAEDGESEGDTDIDDTVSADDADSADDAASADDTVDGDDSADDADDTDEDEASGVVKDKKNKKKKDKDSEVKENLFKNLANLSETLRDEVNAHVTQSMSKVGKFVIDCLMTGGTLGRRQFVYQEDGEIKYYSTMQEAEEAAETLTKQRNHVMARAHYSYTPRAVKDQRNTK